MVLDVVLDFLEDLALDVLPDLLGLVVSGLQPFVEGLVLAAEQDDGIEVVWREDLGVLEVEEESSCGDVVVAGDVLDEFVLVKLGHLELLVPLVAELVVDDQFGDGEIGEVEGFVDQLAEGRLARPRSARDQDVRHLPRGVFFGDHC